MINSRDLSDLRADVRVNVETLLSLCRARGLNVLITQTVRDNEYQAYLYAQGRTRPGAIITNSKVTTFHGKGLAVDFCKNVKGHEYDDTEFFRKVAAVAKQIGFSWGGHMSESIVVALIGLAGSAIGAFVGIMVNAKMMSYRLEQLEARFDKITSAQSSLDARIYELEKHNEVQDEKIRTMNEHIADLERKVNA